MIALMLLASTTPAFLTGDRLLKLCQTNGAACVSYLEGVSDTTDILQSLKATPRRYCPPQEITTAQIRDVVVEFLKENPASGSDGAGGVVWSALIRAFPCKGEPGARSETKAKPKVKPKSKPRKR